MPIYEYACTNCGHTLDALQKISEAPLTECPACGESALKRLISAPRFRLKGDGWYETDFKKDNQRNLAKGDGEPEKKAADKSETKKDSSSDKKTPQKPAKSSDKKTGTD